MRVAVRALCALVLVPSAAAAQQGSRDAGPEAAARAWFAAQAREQWLEAARYLVLAPLDSERLQMLDVMRRQGPTRPRLPEDFLHGDSTMPREVAEWFAKQSDRYVALEDSFLSTMYAHVRDTAELKALDPVEVAARWLEAQDPRYRFRQGMILCGEPAVLPDSLARTLGASRQVLGAVRRGDTAWVMHRDSTISGVAALAAFGPQVMTLVRQDATWRILPRDPMHNGAISIGFGCSGGGLRQDPPPVRDLAAARRPR